MRIVEGASFIAAPSAALHLLQLGAEVIRFDQIGGGPDYHRWPVTPDGASLYWEGLNKGKKSIAIDLSRPRAASWRRRSSRAPGDDRRPVRHELSARKGFSPTPGSRRSAPT